jgi:hypothetical protein
MSSARKSVPSISTTPVKTFADRLLAALPTSPVPPNLKNETEFKQQFLEPLVWRLAEDITGVRVLTTPWRNEQCCTTDCDSARSGKGKVQKGCPKCWHHSKTLWSVGTHGTQHTFDVVAEDATARLVVEAKFVKVSGGRMPNDGMQRFFGQCALAASKHPFVIGVLGYRGTLSPKATHNADTEKVERWFQKAGVELSFVKVP